MLLAAVGEGLSDARPERILKSDSGVADALEDEFLNAFTLVSPRSCRCCLESTAMLCTRLAPAAAERSSSVMVCRA